MQAVIDRESVRRRVRYRIRRRMEGTAGRPRLAVFRSSKHIYAQAIDDRAGRTLAQASTLESEVRGDGPRGASIAAAKRVGAMIAGRLVAAGIEFVTFDRGGFAYHGRIKALADAAREGGLKF